MDQSGFDVRFEWGQAGLRALAPGSDAVVIVDVLCFTTCVDVAIGRSAEVLPYRWEDDSAAEFARRKGAVLAGGRGEGGFSLSPQSFVSAPAGARVVLPSPNGSSLSMSCTAPALVAGCLRNASSVATAALGLGSRISVVAAGERWPDGSLRPCLEDLLGAGAILSGLSGKRSPEADVAVGGFLALRDRLRWALANTWSGRELIGWGEEGDLDLAADLDVSETAPRLRDGAFRAD